MEIDLYVRFLMKPKVKSFSGLPEDSSHCSNQHGHFQMSDPKSTVTEKIYMTDLRTNCSNYHFDAIGI